VAYAAARAAFEEHSLLVLRGQDVSDELQLVLLPGTIMRTRALRPWPSHVARLMIRTTISATEADRVAAMRPPSWQAAE
jgi:hypothetical protein